MLAIDFLIIVVNFEIVSNLIGHNIARIVYFSSREDVQNTGKGEFDALI